MAPKPLSFIEGLGSPPERGSPRTATRPYESLDGVVGGVRLGSAVTRNGSANRRGNSIQEVRMEQTPPDSHPASGGVC